MRLSDLAGKEMIDVINGERLGMVAQADLAIDIQTGAIQALILPVRSSWFKKADMEIEIPWNHIKKIGSEMVIVEAQRKQYATRE
ncbi:MAG: YlmC/YmxH family sporulation protein [Novibacillus thermophilus]|jgi:YlmC/YmxH family sporulation protein|uniref:YlmC/YmxH family sporulation protein n=1 Tax=Novibacillus thermophilus TaxID=1471761 RepID=A0A1U9K9X7_9BACL|nr:YlmC/YmxH family sporulation protein [Novibacillus thermophilus]AQS56842.1 YlmC/YmxH family sporulation protein [Novibacillus thermophilus]